ncbi:MAG: DNA-binding response regulator [Bacteroidetes bacterium]|nr:MAG: DNA-binding response regulator [Bacteroidota bacterium]
MHPISIVIAESHYLVREGLKSILKDQPHFQIVGEALSEDQLLRLLHRQGPRLVIIDYHEPAFGVLSIKKIFESHPDTQVLIITSDLDRERILNVLRFGVKGFLLKNCDKAEILGAIKALERNEKFFCNKVLDILLDREMGNMEEACEPTQLSERESEIVALMAEGLNAQQIADKLSLSKHTIYTHRKNIMKKLKVSSAAEVILYGIQTAQERSQVE